ncbi:MAG: hypothetical protein ABWX83_00195 [Luteibacter sp.]
MIRLFATLSLLVAALSAAGSARAAGGRVAFNGNIVSAGCPVFDQRLDCPPGQQGSAVVHALDVDPAELPVPSRLLHYAIHRSEPGARDGWRLVEVTWR